MMQLLNLGCGNRYHKGWTNIDFVNDNAGIINHNLLNGIPFPDLQFDVVYHSHVLEHFSQEDGRIFIAECYRVLKKGGIIRIAVPDLERIAKEYLKNMELALMGDKHGAHNYEWIKLELLDQMIRNEGGGNMVKYIFQENIPNEMYVYDRLGEEIRQIRQSYVRQQNEHLTLPLNNVKQSKFSIRSVIWKTKSHLKYLLFQKRVKALEKWEKEAAIGKFRLGGEVHQWMYDRYSLFKLLTEAGFLLVETKDAFTSNILEWNSYELESKNGIIHKPDSLFMEAIK